MASGHRYGEVNNVRDLEEINSTIRREMRGAETHAHRLRLKRESDYFIALSESPAWHSEFGHRIGAIRKAAREEAEKTNELYDRLEHEYGRRRR